MAALKPAELRKLRQRCPKCNILVTPIVVGHLVTSDGNHWHKLTYDCPCWHSWDDTTPVTRRPAQRWRTVIERQKVLARRNTRKTPTSK